MSESIKCRECAEEVKAEAKKCKHCHADLRNWMNRHPFISFLIVVWVGGAFITSANPGGSSSSATSESSSSGGTNQYAVTCAEKGVESILNYPSTADFSMFDNSTYKVSENIYNASGPVSAQNGFGVETDYTYYCQVDLSNDSCSADCSVQEI